VGCPGVFFCLADKHTYYPVVWGVLINRQNTQYKIKRNSTRFKWTLFVRQSSQKQAVCAESRYQKQIEDAGIDDKGKRKYQTMKYNYGAFRYPGQGMRALLNILHLRHLFEFILSLATGRITGALQDSMAIKAVFQFPQAILQTLLWYYGNYSTTNEALSLFSVLGSLLCIAAVPQYVFPICFANMRWSTRMVTYNFQFNTVFWRSLSKKWFRIRRWNIKNK